jgi:hypothetical protein
MRRRMRKLNKKVSSGSVHSLIQFDRVHCIMLVDSLTRHGQMEQEGERNRRKKRERKERNMTEKKQC